MNDQKLSGLIGLAFKARQAVSGMEACRVLCRSGKCGVILLDDDAGTNTRKKAEEICRRSGSELRILPAGMIERATGRCNIIIAVCKGSFADTICKITQYDLP